MDLILILSMHTFARGALSSSRSLRLQVILSHRAPQLSRYQSTSSGSNESATDSLSPRWLSDLKTRIGKCINFGISGEQMKEAGAILHDVNSNWRDMVAGSEGFLTGENRWGLYRQQVAWGEMVWCSLSGAIR